MSTLTGEQIGYLIYQNKKWGPGGHASKETVIQFLDTAIAIALAESGGKTDEISTTQDYGLWQINKPAHGDLFTDHTWSDPHDNCDMARIVWERAGKSFSPWVTYNSGAYRAHLGYGQKVWDKVMPLVKNKDSAGLQALLNTIPLVGPAAGAAAAGAGLSLPNGGDIMAKVAALVSGAMSDLMRYFSEGLLAVGAFIFAIVLLVIGFWMLVKDSSAGQAAKGVAEKAGLAAALA